MPAPNASTVPTEITLHQKSEVLELAYSDGRRVRLPFEFLRVYSPSAEVRGHGPGQETLQAGKLGIKITGLEPVGNYALQPTFSDGHNTGIFSWEYLHEIGANYAKLWREYLDKLQRAGASRDPAAQDIPTATHAKP